MVPEKNVTVPLGASPKLLVFTVAVSVTLLPWPTLLLLEVRDVVVEPFAMVTLTAVELLGLKLASPP